MAQIHIAPLMSDLILEFNCLSRKLTEFCPQGSLPAVMQGEQGLIR